MRKKLLSALAMCAAIAIVSASGASTISALAGITTNSPVGDGLMENGGINDTNFMVQGDTDPSAYAVSKGNTTYRMNEIAWRNSLVSPMKKVPKADVVDGAKIVMQYDMYSFGTAWSQMMYLSPFASVQGWQDNYLSMRLHADGTNFQVFPTGAQVYYAAQGDQAEKWDAPQVNAVTKDFGLQMNVLAEQKTAGRAYVTMWLEYDVGAKSLTVYAGNAEANVKKEYGTMKNAFTLPEGADGYYFNFGMDENNIEFDNFKLYRTLNDQTTTYADFDFETPDKIIAEGNAEKQDCLVIRIDKTESGTGAFKTYETLLSVTNPDADTRLSTLNPLKVDDSLSTTFKMTAGLSLNTAVAGQKAGIAFGLDKYSTKLSAPKGGASFLYLTVDAENKILLGADNIAEDGTSTAVGTPAVLEGATLGKTVKFSVEGKPNNVIDVKVGEETYTFSGLKLNGNLSFTQTGEGDMAYSIAPDLFEVTGFSFTENARTDAVTSNFDGNYISSSKFAQQSIVAPDSFITVTDKTSHEVSGITAENGKIGFYGTSTNTRMMFNDVYADFVLQFDYISSPYTTRALPSGLATGSTPTRFSPFYILFGAENEIPELSQAYAVGIIDGNATQYFWGGESLISCEGKMSGTTVLSTLKETAKSDTAIPWYTAKDGGGYEASKYGVPNTEAASFKYTFYNKTTRIKMVVINNNAALYAAEVGTNGTIGEYVKIWEKKVSNSGGYVGFGTDAPGWYEMDNVALTPIAKETAIEKGVDAVPAVDLVADVAPAAMDTDPEPTPLAKPVLVLDAAGKKVTWEAVANAKEYEVVVARNKGTDKVIETTVTKPEIDLSSITEYGDYTITVKAIPQDEALYLESTGKIAYKFSAPEPDPGNSSSETPSSSSDTPNSSSGGGTSSPSADSGCGSVVSITAGVALAAAVAGIVWKKRRND